VAKAGGRCNRHVFEEPGNAGRVSHRRSYSMVKHLSSLAASRHQNPLHGETFLFVSSSVSLEHLLLLNGDMGSVAKALPAGYHRTSANCTGIMQSKAKRKC
jgi:hypothetical protein